MTTGWIGYASVVAVAIGAYIWIILVLRVSGKRSLAQLNAFDFVVTVALGSTLASVIVSGGTGLFQGGLAIATLVILQFAVSRLSLASDFVRKAVRARPTLLVEKGELLDCALRRERVTRHEIAEAIRKQGIGRLRDVSAVVLETDGSFSVLTGPAGDLDLLSDVRRIGGKG